MTVPVRGSIRYDPRGAWLEEISRRLIALEKASGGTASTAAGPTFAAPATPAFGGGSSGGPSSGGSSPTGTSDHGALTGLQDDDHPQYAPVGAAISQHQHVPDDIVALEHRFLRRLEPARPLPHGHSAEELQLDSRFYRRGERVRPEAHAHVMGDVADLFPNDAQFILASRIFGG